MEFREATLTDIPQLHEVRLSVNENKLSRPDVVKPADYEKYLTTHGKGWLYESEGKIAGFAIVDTEDQNIWALFVAPHAEARGIGKKLHHLMLQWYFEHHEKSLWLSTAPGTRAEVFYAKQGWKNAGWTAGGEVKFILDKTTWLNRQ